MLRIGIIGAGFIGMQHIEAIGRIPGSKIVAIADNKLDWLKELQGKGLCEHIYLDYKEMIENEKLDAVHNCTPTNIHFDVSKLLIEKNIHIFSEKPLAKTAEEGDELIKLLEGKELVNAVNFNYRNNLLAKEMHERIKADEFGKTFLVQGEYLQDWLMYQSDYDWRMDLEIGGKSRALSDIGSHCFDFIEYVTSKRIVAVNAKLIKVFDKRKKYQKAGTFVEVDKDSVDYELVDVLNEDGGLINIELEDGVFGSVVISQISAGKKNGLKVSVFGENNSLEWSQEQSDRLKIGFRDKGNEEIYADAKYVSDGAKEFATLPNGHPVGWHDALTNGIRAFYKSIDEENYNEKQTFATFKDANHILKVVEACFESDKLGKWIKVKN